MEECIPVKNTGLRGVTIASSRIADVRGAEGKLIYRGYLIQDLAEKASYEEVCYLLLYEKLPNAGELKAFKEVLAKERQVPSGVMAALKTCPADALPMDVLQAGVSLLAHHDPDTRHPGRQAAERMAVRLIARLPVILAAWGRIREGKEPVAPSLDLNHSADFLYMLFGKVPDPEVARFFDTGMVLHAEHTFNASTFAAREVASTRAHMYAAVAAAIGSLSGELHGGANVRVMEMLQAIGTPDAVESYVEKVLEKGERIMGLGHAVYQTDDPRAYILAPMSKIMGEKSGDIRWYEISKRLEKVGKAAFKQKKGRDIYVNVDFYSAGMYYAMGIPIDFFTPVFAISRVVGWVTHVLEEQFAGAAPKPIIYRPESEYVGDYCGPDECRYIPLKER